MNSLLKKKSGKWQRTGSAEIKLHLTDSLSLHERYKILKLTTRKFKTSPTQIPQIGNIAKGQEKSNK